MADIAVAGALFLVEKVISFIYQEASQKNKVHDGVAEIKDWLLTMQSHLKGMEGIEGNEGEKDRVRQVRDIACKIEDALDEFMLQIPIHHHTNLLSKGLHNLKHSFTDQSAFQDMSSKIEAIQKKTRSLLDLEPLRTARAISRDNSSGSSTIRVENHIVTPHIPEEDEILGFDEDKEKIINQLINGGERRRKTLAVVGPPSSGKSVLVKMVYNDRRVRTKFDFHAWVHVTRSVQIEELLLNLLNQLCTKMKVAVGQGGVDTRENLRHFLEQKRYIVVLDDIWSKQVLENIASALPSGLPGSAIIVTTRSGPDVASSYIDIHTLNYLSHHMAWELFCKKAFNSRKCPPELWDWSQKIVKRCEGLPLAIVAVGSLLSTKQKNPIEWKKLHDSLGSEIGSNYHLSIITIALLPSYNDLPSHLKSCFLYMGIFPEDYSVKRGRLIRSWVAEGFVKAMRGLTLEEVAEDYLNELIGRNLVLASAIDFDGRVRSCRVQNLVREFIIMKSEENNFVTVLGESNISSDIKGCRRLSVHHACTINMSQKGDLSLARTFFKFGRNIGSFPTLGDFKLLKVLDMQDSALNNFPEQIVELRLLRYLSLRQTNIGAVPKSIKKLAHLETLDLKHTQVTWLPKEILKLQKLRHLFVYHYNVKDYVDFDSAGGVEVFAGLGDLPAIQKLSLIKAGQHQGTSAKIFQQQGSIIEELGKLVQLRKLGLVDLRKEDGKKLCLAIQKMTSLSTLDVRSTTKEEYLDLDAMNDNPPQLLQRLYLKGPLSAFPRWIGSLSSLARIGLKWSRLNKSPLDTLQDLPNLIELQMFDAFIGQELVFEATKFKKLKILLIEQLDYLNTMVVEQRAMPMLKKLSIRKCKNLKLLPLGIDHVLQLEELLLHDMPNEFIAKIKKGSEDRPMVAHIPVIHSFTLVNTQGKHWWSFMNLS